MTSLPVQTRDPNPTPLFDTVDLLDRARFEFANAQLWADLEAIEAAVAVQRGEAA